MPADITYQTHISQKLKRSRLAVSLFFFCQGLVFASWASRIPMIKHHLQLSEGTLGTTLLLMPLGQLLTMTLSGKLVSTYGSTKIIPIASLLYACILCCISFVSNIYHLGICLFCFGIFSNMGNIAVNTQGVTVENLYKRSIMSSFHGAWSLAGFIGALIGLFTVNLELNILTHFCIILFIVILNALINSSHLITDPNRTNNNTATKKIIKPDNLIIQLGIICFLVMATEGAMFDWSGVYFHDIIKVKAEWVPLGYTSFMIMMATGRFLGDSTIRKFGKLKTLQSSGIMMSVGILIAVIFPHIWSAMFGFMIVGLGVATVVPTIYSAAGQHPTIPPGRALALVSSISFLGFLIGPPLIGYIAEWSNLKYSFAVFASFGIILFILVSKLRKL
jgi:MFS family permease